MNSNALAPEMVQEQRLVQQQKAWRLLVLKETIKAPPITEDKHREHGQAVAGPLLNRRESSGSLSAASASSDRELMAPPMVPPPTPFRDNPGAAIGDGAAHLPEVTATPAPGQEDEDEYALVQWLSRP